LLSLPPRQAAQRTVEDDAVPVGDGDIVLNLDGQACGLPR